MKRIQFLFIIIFSANICHDSYAKKAMLEKSMTVLSKGANEAVDKFDDTVKETTQTVSNSVDNMSDALPNFGANTAETVTASLDRNATKVADSVNGLTKQLPDVGINATQIVAKTIDRAVMVAAAAVIATGAYVAYREVKNGYHYFFPSTEEQLRQQEVIKKINILKAEDKLYKCLVEHARKERNNQGLPCACEEASKNYTSFAGFAAFNKMAEEFRQATGQTPQQKCAA